MNDEQILEVVGLVHRKWAEVFDTKLNVEKEKNDGSPDWEGFHEMRLELATKAFIFWSDLKNAIQSDYKDTIAKMF